MAETWESVHPIHIPGIALTYDVTYVSYVYHKNVIHVGVGAWVHPMVII